MIYSYNNIYLHMKSQHLIENFLFFSILVLLLSCANKKGTEPEIEKIQDEYQERDTEINDSTSLVLTACHLSY